MSSRFDADDVDLTIESRREGDATVVTTCGEITVFSSPQLRDALHKLAQAQPGRIVLDLAETSYVDSSGVATLVDVLRSVRQQGGDMALSGVKPRVRGVFEIARLDSLFPMFESVEDALKS